MYSLYSELVVLKKNMNDSAHRNVIIKLIYFGYIQGIIPIWYSQ